MNWSTNFLPDLLKFYFGFVLDFYLPCFTAVGLIIGIALVACTEVLDLVASFIHYMQEMYSPVEVLINPCHSVVAYSIKLMDSSTLSLAHMHSYLVSTLTSTPNC